MSKLYISIISIIVLLITSIYIYKDANIIITSSQDEPYIEQKNNFTVGYENGKKIFNIKLHSVKQHRYPHILHGKHIRNGTVYNPNEIPVITSLSGNHARVNTAIKSIIVTANINAIIEPSTSTKSVHISAEKFQYNHKKKLATFNESATLTVDNITIDANQLLYHNTTETLLLASGFSIQTTHSKTTAINGEVSIDASVIVATKNVLSRYQKQAKPTDSHQIKHLLKNPITIQADTMAIDFSQHHQSTITYNQRVRASQPGKTMKSDTLVLNFKSKTFKAISNIQLSFKELSWLLPAKRRIKNPTIQPMLKKETRINADHATFNQALNQFTFKSNITVNQGHMKLTCDQMVYHIPNETIRFTGNVVIKKLGIEYLTANTLTLDIKNETFRSDSPESLSEIILEL